MSAKKSNTKTSPLDDTLIEEPVATAAANMNKVSLSEYHKTSPFSFTAKNYKLLLIGLAVNILGFIVMIGGGAESLDEFNADELFSTMRITIAPMLIVAGYVIIMFAIMKKPKAE